MITTATGSGSYDRADNGGVQLRHKHMQRNEAVLLFCTSDYSYDIKVNKPAATPAPVFERLSYDEPGDHIKVDGVLHSRSE